MKVVCRGYYMVTRRYGFYLRMMKQYFTNERRSE